MPRAGYENLENVPQKVTSCQISTLVKCCKEFASNSGGYRRGQKETTVPENPAGLKRFHWLRGQVGAKNGLFWCVL